MIIVSLLLKIQREKTVFEIRLDKMFKFEPQFEKQNKHGTS